MTSFLFLRIAYGIVHPTVIYSYSKKFAPGKKSLFSSTKFVQSDALTHRHKFCFFHLRAMVPSLPTRSCNPEAENRYHIYIYADGGVVV